MNRPICNIFSCIMLGLAASHGYAQTPLTASLATPSAVKAPILFNYTGDLNHLSPAPDNKRRTAAAAHKDILTKYEQTCASRFFEFCDYLLTPPDIVIDSASYSAGQKQEEIVMQRERAGDTARIKKAVLRYTVVPVPTNTNDSLHFSPEEMSDQSYRNLETAFSTLEKLLDTCYNMGGTPLKLMPLRLHDNAFIRSQLDQGQLPRTFLLQRGRQTLAVLVFTPQNRMTPTAPPRICGWSVDFRRGRMIFHNISADGQVAFNNR